MATVRLRAPLRERAGGEPTHRLPGATVGEVLRELERRHPPITGWILDEQGRVRRHVNVFVNGERIRGDAPVVDDDVVQVLPSISGGST
jgi:sulfur-carrier protein